MPDSPGVSVSGHGEFERQDTAFRDWIGPDPRGGDPGPAPEPGRFHLYVSLACPWCRRTVILRELAGLQEAVPIHYLAPYRDERGWAFSGERFEDGPGGEYVDELNGWDFISRAYAASQPDFDGHVSVPVLWDAKEERIVNNESSEIIRMMGDSASLGALGSTGGLDLYPESLREKIDAINERVYATVNNGVYRAGFARGQHAYERAFGELFDSLTWLEAILSNRRYLLGEQITEADWRLFPTLVRFDEVYNLHFRCNRRRLVDHPNLWAFARELHQFPGVSETVAMGQIKRHYYTTHDELNPKKIIPVGPGYDWSEPHGRDTL
ncbi:MAG TPA: glutathione S-transferase C-terminal domain-containing protein [Solirubrobacteraceae bacterium]|jgi:putative glutathione S-transferase|nr:glutathione S-transferase C-terminal domain-containing protein [Solirubrobacteraceae bacterium]